MINDDRSLNLSKRSSIHYLLNDVPKKRMKSKEEGIIDNINFSNIRSESSLSLNDPLFDKRVPTTMLISPTRSSSPFNILSYDQSFKIPLSLNNASSSSSPINNNKKSFLINDQFTVVGKPPSFYQHNSLSSLSPPVHINDSQIVIKSNNDMNELNHSHRINNNNTAYDDIHGHIYPQSNPLLSTNSSHHYPFINIQQSPRGYDHYHYEHQNFINQSYNYPLSINRKDVQLSNLSSNRNNISSPSSSTQSQLPSPSIDIHKMPKTIPKISTPSYIPPGVVYNINEPLIIDQNSRTPSTYSIYPSTLQQHQHPQHQHQQKRKESKRNKFFYKEVKDILLQGDNSNINDNDDTCKDKKNSKSSLIGFISDIYFLFNPKLYVGPSNRDGTFEKRVRLHFIDYIEINHDDPLWICWGTLLDSFGYPIFRKSTDIYRIPGNQSTLFKSSQHLYGWQLASDEQKQSLYDDAQKVKEIIEKKLKEDKVKNNNTSLDDLKKLVQPILSQKTPNQYELFKIVNSSSEYPYKFIWNELLKVENDIENRKILFNSKHQLTLTNLTSINDEKYYHLLKDILESISIIDNDGYLNEENFRLLYLYFGPFDSGFFRRMIQLVETRCFNCDIDSEKTKELLFDKDNGTYIIRYSNKIRGTFCIGYKDDKGNIVQYYNIKNDIENGSKLNVDSKIFDSWNDLIQYFGRDILKHPYISSKNTKMHNLLVQLSRD